MRTRSRTLKLVCLAAAVSLVAAACGDDDEDTASTTPAAAETTEGGGAETTEGGTETTEGGTDTTEGGTDTTESGGSATTTGGSGSGSGGGDCASGPDDALDEENGVGAGWLAWALTCAEESPMKAEGEPIVIGLQNPEGDPAGTFPEYTIAAEAAVDYINNELGGIGADYEAGTPGRPIELKVCKMAITPADSQRCANELASEKPFAVFSTLNFFGNHFEVLTGAGIPVFVGTPISPADFTTPGVYAIGGGGGCLGVHTGLVEFVTKDLGKKKIAVPWADTPPGVFCYHDLEKKPLNVLNGSTPGDAENAGSIPDLTHIGVPIKPGSADVTPQATEVLGFEPDAIIFSAQGADCWTLVSALSRLGWDPKTTPLVMTGACQDTERAKEAGDAAIGTYFIGATPIQDPSVLEGQLQREAQIYQDKMDEYGGGEVKTKGFATQGFLGTMLIWQMANEASPNDPDGLTGENLAEAIAATSNHHAFAGTPQNCAEAVEPYVAVCNATVTATQWDGETYQVIRQNYSGVYLLEGTELDFGN